MNLALFRRLTGAALVVFSTSVAGLARADADATPEQIQAAAEAFDRGRDAYKAERYAEAAEQFERADANAPSATTLELAIKARDKAGDLDRAATLALLATERYADEILADETAIGKVAPKILERARIALFELKVTCTEACQLVDGKKLVHGVPAPLRTVFLTPGSHDLVAGWSEGRTQAKTVEAVVGTSGELTFEAPEVPEASPAEPASTSPPLASATPIDAGPRRAGGWAPTVFFVGAGLTAVAGGVTVWSGIDTVNSPGAERVKNECAAGDQNCALYKEGRARQLRTNVLIGVTGGLAVFTGVVGALLTDWGGSVADQAGGKTAKRRKVKVQPWAGWSHGPALGAKGRF